MLNRLRDRVLNSLAFRSGYRLVPASDPRAQSLPALEVPVQLSALHAHQVGGVQSDSGFLSRILPVIELASHTSLDHIDQRIPANHPSKGAVHHWPGNHYRLLAAMVQHFQPRVVVEIGTATGLGFLSLAANLADDAKLVTFDIVPHERLPDSRLLAEDFKAGLRYQVIGDLSDERTFDEHSDLLRSCELLFMDGPKNGKFEYRFWELLERRGLAPGALVVLDDIRLSEMLKFWRDLKMPKLDLITFGHFTGTGVFWWP